jgi:DNA-binding response OmpR family regulator
MTLRVAIIEDSADLLDELLAFLRHRGFDAWGVRSAEAFWRQLHRDPVDIVLIDIGLPGEDGFSVLDYLHEIGQFGLVVVTARGHEQDRLQALNAGADLYLIKPVNFSDLAESIQALGSRLRQQNRRNASTRRYQQSGQRRLTGYSRASTLWRRLGWPCRSRSKSIGCWKC